jgi:hypothetical protein
MARCGALTQDGTRCKNPVKRRGQQCHLHRHGGTRSTRSSKRATPNRRGSRTSQPWGQSRRSTPKRTAPPWRQPTQPAPKPRPPTEAERQEARLRAAAKYVVGALYPGWPDDICERVAKYVTDRTWKRIRRGWRDGRCQRLAQLARDILNGKHTLHQIAGWAASKTTRLLGGQKIEQVFAAELAQRLPQPTDRPLDTLAKSIRITGITLCAAAGRDLNKCACFRDLAQAETNRQVERLLLNAADNYWATHYQPPTTDTTQGPS